MPKLKEAARVLNWSADHVTGTWSEVGFLCWRGPVSALLLQQQFQLLSQWGKQWPRGFMLFANFEPQAPLPDAEARRAIIRNLTTLGPRLRCGGVVVVGEGFAAAAQRAMVAGINALVRRPFPNSVFGSGLEAAQFAKHHVENSSDFSNQFVAALNYLRSYQGPVGG